MIAFPYLALRRDHRTGLGRGLLYPAASVSTALFGLAIGFVADGWREGVMLAMIAL